MRGGTATGGQPPPPHSRVLLLFFILVFCLLSQWMRWLPVYLSAVTLAECETADACLGVAFTPICQGCSGNSSTAEYASCVACLECRQTYHSEVYNFEDGVCMTTTEYGVLTGVGFSFTFSLFGLFAGFIVDLYANRDGTILGISALFCALTTLLTSYCSSFEQVVVLRAALGAFQAFGAPASVHLIMSHFERAADRPMANSSYTVGVYLGAGLSSLSSLISERLGWKATFALAGYLGIATALLYELLMDVGAHFCLPFSGVRGSTSANERNPLLYKGSSVDSSSHSQAGATAAGFAAVAADDASQEVRRSISNDGGASPKPAMRSSSDIEGSFGEQPDLSSSGLDNFSAGRRGGRARAASFLSHSSSCEKALAAITRVFSFSGVVPGAMVLLLLGSCLRFAASIAVFVFVPVLVSRRFPSYGTVFSIFNALVVLSCGSFSAFLGGRLGQMAVRRWGMAGLSRLIALSGALCMGPFVACILSEDFWSCMVLLALGYLFGEAWMGASMALLQGLAPIRAQGLAMSLYLFLNWNLSAAATDTLGYLDPGTVHLAKFMTVFVCVPISLSCLCFILLDRLITAFEIRRERVDQDADLLSSKDALRSRSAD